jgi:hypothetical protein
VDGLPAGRVTLRVSSGADPLLERQVDVEARTSAPERVEVRLPPGSAFALAWPAAPEGCKILIRGVTLEAETFARRVRGSDLFHGAGRLPEGEFEAVATVGEEDVHRERFQARGGRPVRLHWTD